MRANPNAPARQRRPSSGGPAGSPEGWSVVFPQKLCCCFPYAFLCIHMHACAFNMHFIVFSMHSYVLHSTNRLHSLLHSNAFYNHFELLHSSDARRLHSYAFSYQPPSPPSACTNSLDRGGGVSARAHACVALGRCVAFGRPKMSVWGHAGAGSPSSKVACISFLRPLFGTYLMFLFRFFCFRRRRLSAHYHSARAHAPWRPSIAHRTQ